MRLENLTLGHVPASIVLAPLEEGSAGWNHVDQEVVVAEDAPATGHSSELMVVLPLGLGDARSNFFSQVVTFMLEQQGSFMWKDVPVARHNTAFIAFSPFEEGDAGRSDVSPSESTETVACSRYYENFYERILCAPTGLGKTVAAVKQLRSRLTQISMAHVTASMVQSAQLSTGLRTFIDQTRPHSVDRRWVLAEYTVLAASLLALDRERRLQQGCGEWFRIRGIEHIKPLLLPISSDLVGSPMSSSLSRCLLGSKGSRPVAHDLVDICCADDFVAKAPDRKELAHFLSVLPSTVEFTPAMSELHRRACKALAQRPVQGVKFSGESGVQKTPCAANDQLALVNHDPDRSIEYFDQKIFKRYNGRMDDDPCNRKTVLPTRSGSMPTEDQELTFCSAGATVAPRPANEEPTKTKSAGPSLVGMPIQLASEVQSPFSTKKIMQILMGKLPKPEILD